MGVAIIPHSLRVDGDELGLTLTVQFTNGSLDLGGGGGSACINVNKINTQNILLMGNDSSSSKMTMESCEPSTSHVLALIPVLWY